MIIKKGYYRTTPDRCLYKIVYIFDQDDVNNLFGIVIKDNNKYRSEKNVNGMVGRTVVPPLEFMQKYTKRITNKKEIKELDKIRFLYKL